MTDTEVFLDVVFNLPVNRTFSYRPPEGVPCAVGMRVKAPFGGRMLIGYIVGVGNKRPEGNFAIRAIIKVLDVEPIFGQELLDLSLWMSGMYMCSLGEALATMIPGARRESRLQIDYGSETNTEIDFDLSLAQQEALTAINGRQDGMFYLYGVTGSGKTEVFLRAAAHTLTEGRSVIYLVPEISLTHQLVSILKRRFGQLLAVIHSRLTPSQKLVEWTRIRSGKARLVLGARSAIFAPVSNLGLIVVDEEHEGSYKSGSTPRYHARQVAMRRRSTEKARLVLGSATPSVEAFHLMSEKVLQKIVLPERLSGGDMPVITVADMKGEKNLLSKTLIRSMQETLDAGRQVILFLNRRGFAHFFHCNSCGHKMTCRQCSVTLTYHRRQNRMLCHYCGFSIEPVEVCPDCGSLDVGYSGFGTEQVESEVCRQFPNLVVKRADTDAVRKKGALQEILDEFYSGKTHILLGTQMVAKGLNFPGVKLVGIISADTGLQLPDFRAEERTFSLIVQVSGRAGRFLPDGQVIVQTYRPDNVAVKMAAEGNLEEYYSQELDARRSMGFPPFARLIRVVFRGKSLAKVTRLSADFSSGLEKALHPDDELLGPVECPLATIAGNHRHHVILRTRSFSRGHGTLKSFVGGFRIPPGVYLEIDVDPVSLL